MNSLFLPQFNKKLKQNDQVNSLVALRYRRKLLLLVVVVNSRYYVVNLVRGI